MHRICYKATSHCSKIIRKFFVVNKDTLKLEYFLVGFREFKAVEECGWLCKCTFYLLPIPI